VGLRRFAASIEGVTEFIWNRYVEEAEIVAAIGPRPKDLSKEDEWRKKEGMLRLYLNGGTEPVLPGRNIRSSMIQGADASALRHKHGKTQRALGPFLRRGLVVKPLWIPFKDVTVTLHRDIVRIPPRTGPTVVKYWPKADQWSLDFELEVYDDSLQGESELFASLEAAGIFCGIGTGRPDYGKFAVTKWEELPLEKAAGAKK